MTIPAPVHRAPSGPFVPKYRVMSPLALVKDADGYVHHCYRDTPLEWLNPEQEKRFLAEGLVEKVDTK